MKIGILGSGNAARALGTGFVALGHEVRLGTRHPDRPNLTNWTDESSGLGGVGSFADAARFGEIVVVATLGVATAEAVREAGVSLFDGKVVIDTTNPLVFHENGPPSLALGHTTSGGEELQKLLPKARVVKAFNIIGHRLFFRPELPGGPPDMFLAGNDDEAKRSVERILHAFGWPSVYDVGGIDASRELEAFLLLWIKLAQQLGNFRIGFRLLRG